MLKGLCICDAIPQFALQTRLIVVMHTAEEVLTTNTARLVAKVLTNSEVRIRGRKDRRLDTADLAAAGDTCLLLFPSSHAAELNAEFAARLPGPATLVVPDGNWARTRKFVRREPAFATMQHVCLPPGPPSEYRLRTQADDRSLCTLEAVARAVGILESPEAQRRLEELLRVMVERTLWSRGVLTTAQCATGIPADARRG